MSPYGWPCGIYGLPCGIAKGCENFEQRCASFGLNAATLTPSSVFVKQFPVGRLPVGLVDTPPSPFCLRKRSSSFAVWVRFQSLLSSRVHSMSTSVPTTAESSAAPLPSNDRQPGRAGSSSRSWLGVTSRVGVVLLSHAMLDGYAAIMPAAILLIEARCRLTPSQTAWLLGVGPLFSGLAQPVAAWLSDRTDSRLFTGLGLAGCGVGMCSIGYATNFETLLAIYIPTMFAVGAFHPVSAASVGELVGHHRSRAASAFFVSGMMGGAIGAFISPRFLGREGGFDGMLWYSVPALVVAAAAYAAVKRHSHRRPTAHTLSDAKPSRPAATESHRVKSDDSLRLSHGATLRMLMVLYVCGAIRFTVNLSLLFLYARWMESAFAARHPDWTTANVLQQAGAYSGSFVSITLVGMAIGGILAGGLISPGREKWPMVLVPILFAPFIWSMPHWPLQWVPVACLAAGIGFASMVPVGMSVAQRLLPHHTGFASGLMMGGAWAVSTVGPRLAQWSIEQSGIDATFQLTAALLVFSGLMALPLRTAVLRQSVQRC